VTRALVLRFASAIGSATSFYLLLSVVPLSAKAAGGGEGAAGLATSALTFAAVAGELVTPRLVTRYGHRRALAAGLALLGAPALLLAVSASTAVLVTVCAVRGIGFGITCVSGGALTASIIPAERRGEGLALLGVVVGVPSMVALPAGLWLSALWNLAYDAGMGLGAAGFGAVAAQAGYPASFALTAALMLAALAPALRDRRAGDGHRAP
jgi:MFS family permease